MPDFAPVELRRGSLRIRFAQAKAGGDEGIRTPDLYVANVPLSQLSYTPTNPRPDLQYYLFERAANEDYIPPDSEINAFFIETAKKIDIAFRYAINFLLCPRSSGG